MNHEAIARHMSQPRSGCSTWSDNLICLHKDLFMHNQDTDMVVNKPRSMQEYEPGVDWDNMIDSAQANNSQAERPSAIDYFPEAASVFDRGKTFIEKFDANEFSGY